MNKYFYLVPFLLTPGLALASVVGTCTASLPSVDAKRCNDPSYYSVYRAQADSAINTAHDAKTNEIHQDNQANNGTVVDEATLSLAAFLQCQRDTCEAFYKTCTGADIEDVSSRRFGSNSGSCLEESENRYTVAKNLTQTAVKMNTNRKARTTVFEKMQAIMHRGKTITMVIADDLRKEMQTLASKGSFLIRQSKEVSGSSVQ